MINSQNYYGRKTVNDSGIEEYQLLADHLRNVAALAKQYASDFTNPVIGEIEGLLHDIGKYSEDFQKRIRSENIKTDHSSAGAYIAKELAIKGCNPFYGLLSYSIAGHHSGLLDYGNPAYLGSCLCYRFEKCDPEQFSQWSNEIKNIPDLKSDDIHLNMKRETLGFSLAMYTRFLFSCLVDADRTDAAEFAGEKIKKSVLTIPKMREIFQKYMDQFLIAKSNDNQINRIRKEIFQNCMKAAFGECGIYTLSVPTGGGKTLASLAFALLHAEENNCRRIIYSIPFTSIIEQNAAVYSEIFGRENVLEHHSNFINPFHEEDEQNEIQKQATENWNMPLIVTTNVQLFESLFSNKPSRLRKLHNIAGSVIILDEAQAIPSEYVKPCTAALEELVLNYGCSIVLCTATQPCFEKNKLFSVDIKVKEIISNPVELETIMKRVKAVIAGKLSLDVLSERIKEHEQILCIVNTKRHAYDLFKKLNDENVFHLSTNMYPLHRQAVIKEIKRKLIAEEPCKVVSTQLIEAGVDIDFPIVYRSLSGIDSIIQAAGRCNREGKQDKYGNVIVFEPEQEYLGQGYLKLTADLARIIITNYDDILSHGSVEAYFKSLYDVRRENLDKAYIIRKCEEALINLDIPIPQFEFETMSNDFKFINENGTPVIIPCCDEAKELLEQAKYAKGIERISRVLSKYSVNVRDHVLKTLNEEGVISSVADTFLVLNDLSYYDQKLGLLKTNNDYFNYIVP